MTYTFYKAKGLPIGNSLLEEDKVDLAKEPMEKAVKAGVNFMLPIDSVIAKEYKNEAENDEEDEDGIEDGCMAVGIALQTIIDYSNQIKKARTVIWNRLMEV